MKEVQKDKKHHPKLALIGASKLSDTYQATLYGSIYQAWRMTLESEPVSTQKQAQIFRNCSFMLQSEHFAPASERHSIFSYTCCHIFFQLGFDFRLVFLNFSFGFKNWGNE